MSNEDWIEMCADVRQKMSEFVEPFLSPIWKFKTEDDLKLHGTGSYIQSGEKKFILTNEHVAKYISNYNLTHSFCKNSNVLRLTNSFSFRKYPIDIAIGRINDSIWDKEASHGKAISLEQFASKHEPVENELLFFAVFSGKRAGIVFGEMFSRGTTYLSQEFAIPTDVELADSAFHIAFPYPPELVQSSDSSVSLPDPHGFSGSLLWNTRRIECQQNNIEWNPSQSKITGILWGWPTSATCILSTKVEHFKLVDLIQQYDEN